MEGTLEQAAKVSVSIIARNEEKMLRRCLLSVKDADEIVVVDTGSEDGTKEVAREFTDKVYDFEWCDDFAAARNFAKSKCANSYILSIDADEVLAVPFLNVKKWLCGALPAYIDVKIDYPSLYLYAPRLFKNVVTIRWEGKAHNYINVWEKWRKSNITILGSFSPSHRRDPDRSYRILTKEVENGEGGPRSLFYLAYEEALRGQWNNALKHLINFLERPYWSFYQAEARLMIAKIFRQKGVMIESREYATRAFTVNKNFREAADFLAHISHGKEKKEWLRIRDATIDDDVLFYRKGDWCEK